MDESRENTPPRGLDFSGEKIETKLRNRREETACRYFCQMRCGKRGTTRIRTSTKIPGAKTKVMSGMGATLCDKRETNLKRHNHKRH